MIQTIYILWFQGFQNAPDVVKKCVDSWKYYNPDWNIILLDEDNYRQYVDLDKHLDMKNKNIPLTQLSDIIRSLLLEKHGGVWADATTFCNRPLNEWLPDYIGEGFFAFDKPWPNLMLNTWFLYSEKKSYIIKKWCRSTIQYFKTRNEPETYFFFNYLFQDLYREDKKFKTIWDDVPKISGIGARILKEKGFFTKIDAKTKKSIVSKMTPVYKLDYKCEHCDVKHVDVYDKKIVLHYMYSTIA
jgi:hypothetical protein